MRTLPAQDDTTAKSDDLAEKLKADAFYGVSSEPLYVRESFEKRINGRTDKESDFSGVIFSGGVTKELLAEVKEALDPVPWLFDDPDFKEKLIRDLESEIGQPASNAQPKGSLPVRTARKTLGDGFGGSSNLWQQSRKPTKPHGAGRHRRDRGLAGR